MDTILDVLLLIVLGAISIVVRELAYKSKNGYKK